MINNQIVLQLSGAQSRQMIETVETREDDYNSRYITASFVDKDSPYSLPADCEIRVNFKRQFGKVSTYSSNQENSIISIDEDSVICKIPYSQVKDQGFVYCDFNIIDGLSKLTSETFRIRVNKCVGSSADYSEDDAIDLINELEQAAAITRAVADDVTGRLERGEFDGEDGFSPEASSERIDGGTRVTFTTAWGERSFTVFDGEKGEQGDRGIPGEMVDDIIYDDEDERLYLIKDGETIGDGAHLDLEPGLAFDEITTETVDDITYLHIKSNGVDVVEPCVIPSGGGGGSSAEYIMTLTNLLPSRLITVAEGTPVNLQFSYSSVNEDEVDDGAGVGSIIVNNVTKGTIAVPQGNNTVNITDYIPSGTSTVKIKVTNSEGSTKTLSYTVSVVSLSISTTFEEIAAYNGDVTFVYTPAGTGEKTVHFIMDDVEIGTATVLSNHRSQSFVIPAQEHGAHIFKCYATVTVDGVIVPSNVITLGMMWVDQESYIPIVLCPFAISSATQGETLKIPYMVYDPNAETAAVTREIIDEDGNVYSHSEISVGRTAQSWSVSDYPIGSTKFVISCRNVSVIAIVTVEEPSIIIEPITDSLEIEFTADGRSNGEENPESWNYGEGPDKIEASFSGFGWANADGWIDDEDGKTILRFLPNDFMTIPFKPFESDARATGLTIEAEFTTKDVQDYDSIVVSSFSDGRGFKIGSQYAELKSEQSQVSMQFKEDSRVRVCFSVENRNQNRLVYIYINGVMCGVSQYPVNDDFSQATPVGLTIGAESCGIDLYRIRIYGKGLTKNEQLDNYIYDRPTLAQKEEAYYRNDLFDNSEEVDISKLPVTLPYMIIKCPQLPQYKGDKKKGVEVTYVNPSDPAKSFTADGVEMDVQGTSSAGYPVKNFKEKYKSGITYTQSGETASKYALRDDSIPVSTFCLKADYASSEGANNVELVAFYEELCPYKTPPQIENSKVRQGIDGLPMIVFWDDCNGNVSFVGKYNFNNDKSTGEVFGFTDDYPNAESWEFKNNTSNRCLLKASDYTGDEWLNDFEARHPEESTDFTQLKRVTDWIVQTDRDAVNTDEEKEARLQKFIDEFDTYFVKSACIFYYLFTEVFLMIDSRAKNMFLTTYDGEHWLPIPYDFDTALGINNEGVLVFDYDLEDTDQVGGSNVFNGQTSVLWCNVRDAFADDIKEMYKTLRSAGTFSYSNIKEMFERHQSVWPEAIWNEDAFVKYLKPYFVDGENYLSMLQGSKESQRDWWMFNAFRYRDSKYQAGDALSNFITLRCYALGDITVTPYSHIWPTVKYGSYTVRTRGKRNTAYTLINPMDQMNDTEVYIYSADRIKDVGDLSGLQVGYANFSMAAKLQSLKLGDDALGYENTNLKEMYVGNNELLKEIDIRNCTALGTDQQKSIDLSGCASLETVLAQGTSLSGIELPNGGHVTELHFPATITNFTILNQKHLETLTFEGLSNLTTLRVENTPNVDIEDIIETATSLNRVRLINVQWASESSSDLETVIEKLKTCIGMDADGNNTPKAVVTGVVNTSDITEELLLDINANFPELEVVSGGVPIHVVTFINEGTVYATQVVQHGNDATRPGTPYKASTAQYTYTFTGWSGSLTNVTENRRLFAQYTQTVRTYTVRFYSESTLLQTVSNVPYGGTATYTGETPVSTEGREFLGFIPTGENITGNTQCYAQFAYEYEYIEITDSWQDILDSIDDGSYAIKYHIGNYKPLDLGTEGIINMQIVGINKDIKADGNGTAPLTFISEQLLKTAHKTNPLLDGESGNRTEGTGGIGGWGKCEMRMWLKEYVKPLIPETVRSHIVEVTKTSSIYNTDETATQNDITTDDVWIPSTREIFGGTNYETEGIYYASVFNSDSSRQKKPVDKSSVTGWLTRSASSIYNINIVHYSGILQYVPSHLAMHIALGFCLG